MDLKRVHQGNIEKLCESILWIPANETLYFGSPCIFCKLKKQHISPEGKYGKEGICRGMDVETMGERENEMYSNKIKPDEILLCSKRKPSNREELPKIEYEI